MLLLPRNLASLVKITASESARFALTGVKVSETPATETQPAGYVVEATDGKRLIRVSGPNVDNPAEYPSIPALDAAPNGQTTALIPGKEFERAFKECPKKGKPALQSVACVMGAAVSPLATTDLQSSLVRQPRNVDGRYPNTDHVLPKGEPVAAQHVSADLLAELLEVLKHFSGDGTAVTIEIHANGAPMVVRATNGTQRAVAALMPYAWRANDDAAPVGAGVDALAARQRGEKAVENLTGWDEWRREIEFGEELRRMADSEPETSEVPAETALAA